MQRSLDILWCRVQALDARPYRAWALDELSKARGQIYERISHFAHVMGEYTDIRMDIDAGLGATIDPETADEMAAASSLVMDIENVEPSLVVGPLISDHQLWTSTGRSTSGRDQAPPPSAEYFVDPFQRAEYGSKVKPFGAGLYTSSATGAGYSMWQTLMGRYGSYLYPRPWHTWELEISRPVRVVEVKNAASWVEFVCAYGCANDGILYPDWRMIALEYDAIHVTLPAIVAAQGFHFETSSGTIPPAFWDVETTYWLRWCFSGAHLIESLSTD